MGKKLLVFVTPKGLYQYKVMPFGMKNAPATFQRLINQLTRDLDGCEGYIDDIVIYSKTWQQHLECIRSFFNRLTQANLTVNLTKSEFGHPHISFLGHVVGQGEITPVMAKVEAITSFPAPQTKREVMHFLDMAGYYRKFCRNFSIVTASLTNLLRKEQPFIWTSACQEAFDRAKAILLSSPVLTAPDFDKRFKLYVDANDVDAGAVLQQEDDQGIDHSISYFSRKFEDTQRRYSMIEKETLALLLAFKYFRTPAQNMV